MNINKNDLSFVFALPLKAKEMIFGQLNQQEISSFASRSEVDRKKTTEAIQEIFVSIIYPRNQENSNEIPDYNKAFEFAQKIPDSIARKKTIEQFPIFLKGEALKALKSNKYEKALKIANCIPDKKIKRETENSIILEYPALLKRESLEALKNKDDDKAIKIAKSIPDKTIKNETMKIITIDLFTVETLDKCLTFIKDVEDMELKIDTLINICKVICRHPEILNAHPDLEKVIYEIYLQNPELKENPELTDLVLKVGETAEIMTRTKTTSSLQKRDFQPGNSKEESNDLKSSNSINSKKNIEDEFVEIPLEDNNKVSWMDSPILNDVYSLSKRTLFSFNTPKFHVTKGNHILINGKEAGNYNPYRQPFGETHIYHDYPAQSHNYNKYPSQTNMDINYALTLPNSEFRVQKLKEISNELIRVKNFDQFLNLLEMLDGDHRLLLLKHAIKVMKPESQFLVEISIIQAMLEEIPEEQKIESSSKTDFGFTTSTEFGITTTTPSLPGKLKEERERINQKIDKDYSKMREELFGASTENIKYIKSDDQDHFSKCELLISQNKLIEALDYINKYMESDEKIYFLRMTLEVLEHDLKRFNEKEFITIVQNINQAISSLPTNAKLEKIIQSLLKILAPFEDKFVDETAILRLLLEECPHEEVAVYKPMPVRQNLKMEMEPSETPLSPKTLNIVQGNSNKSEKEEVVQTLTKAQNLNNNNSNNNNNNLVNNSSSMAMNERQEYIAEILLSDKNAEDKFNIISAEVGYLSDTLQSRIMAKMTYELIENKNYITAKLAIDMVKDKVVKSQLLEGMINNLLMINKIDFAMSCASEISEYKFQVSSYVNIIRKLIKNDSIDKIFDMLETIETTKLKIELMVVLKDVLTDPSVSFKYGNQIAILETMLEDFKGYR